MPAGLYLVAGAAAVRPEGDDKTTDLIGLLEDLDVACLLLRAGDESALRGLAERLAAPAQATGVAVLLEGAPRLAEETGCDGVHMPAETAQDLKALKAARRQLGGDAIVGALCGASRHSALLAGEAEADYVGFGSLDVGGPAPDPELLAWWQETMTPPCVAFCAETPDQAAALAEAGADFVAVDAADLLGGDVAATARAYTAALNES